MHDQLIFNKRAKAVQWRMDSLQQMVLKQLAIHVRQSHSRSVHDSAFKVSSRLITGLNDYKSSRQKYRKELLMLWDRKRFLRYNTGSTLH